MFYISRDQLVYLRNLYFSWTRISKMLCVSRMTIYRRRSAYGLISEQALVPNDMELAVVVRSIQLNSPEIGQTLISGRIRGIECLEVEYVRQLEHRTQ